MSQIEKILVQNIKCAGCVKSITDALVKLDGIEQVEVDIEHGQVTIKGSQQGFSKETLLTTLNDLGFPARD